MGKNRLSLMRFMLIVSIPFIWLSVLCLLQFSEIFLFGSLLVLLWSVVIVLSLYFVRWFEKIKPTHEANVQEIKREDDVMLQGITFVSAIMFFYLNTLFSDATVKLSLSIAMLFLTGSFYVFRAYAKITANRWYRFFSSFIFVWLASAYVFEFLVLFAPWILPFMFESNWTFISVTSLLLAIPLFSSAFAGWRLPRRYGLKRSRKGRGQTTLTAFRESPSTNDLNFYEQSLSLAVSRFCTTWLGKYLMKFINSRLGSTHLAKELKIKRG